MTMLTVEQATPQQMLAMRSKLEPTIKDFLPPNSSKALLSMFQNKLYELRSDQAIHYGGKIWAVGLGFSLTAAENVTALFLRVHNDKELYLWKLYRKESETREITQYHSTIINDPHDTGEKNTLREKTEALMDTFKCEIGSEEEKQQESTFLFSQIFQQGELREGQEIPKLPQLHANQLKEWLDGETPFFSLIPAPVTITPSELLSHPREKAADLGSDKPAENTPQHPNRADPRHLSHKLFYRLLEGIFTITLAYLAYEVIRRCFSWTVRHPSHKLFYRLLNGICMITLAL